MFLGYEPVWQDMFGTETGDLRAVLRHKIDSCKGVVQLVGSCYGAEPPTVDPEFGRVSYTQYEAMYARRRNKKVWYLFIDEHFPVDPCEQEPPDLRQLQAAYRRCVRTDVHVFHPLTTTEGLEASVLKLRDDLTRLRRGVKRWSMGVTAFLIVIIALIVWLLRNQFETNAKMTRLEQHMPEYAKIDEHVREGNPKGDPADDAKIDEQVHAILGRRSGVDNGTVRAKLSSVAEKILQDPNASAYQRANAAYALKNFPEAERWALQAADEAAKAAPPDVKAGIEGFELAGFSAQRQVRYSAAAQYFRDAEKLTDPNRNLEEWTTVQHATADLLVAQGKYGEAETSFRKLIDACGHALGREHALTLESRHGLIYTLARQSKYSEAEIEAREVLHLRDKVLGPEDPDTIVSRYDLGECLAEEGKYSEAEQLYRDVIHLDEKVLGAEDPRTLSAKVGLATVLGDQGNNADAEPLYRQVIQLAKKVYGATHPYTLYARQDLATTLHDEAKYKEAEAEYRDVIRIAENSVGPDHPDTLMIRNNLAEVLDDEGRYAEAEAECRQILGPEQKDPGPETRLTINTRANLAVALIGQGKCDEAQAEIRQLLNLMMRVLKLQHPDMLRYAAKFVNGLSAQNRKTEAKEIAEDLADRARNVLGADDPSSRKYAKLTELASTR